MNQRFENKSDYDLALVERLNSAIERYMEISRKAQDAGQLSIATEALDHAGNTALTLFNAMNQRHQIVLQQTTIRTRPPIDTDEDPADALRRE